jgi:hypothetical protein
MFKTCRRCQEVNQNINLKCEFVGLRYTQQKKYEKWKEVTKLAESLGLAVAVLSKHCVAKLAKEDIGE